MDSEGKVTSVYHTNRMNFTKEQLHRCLIDGDDAGEVVNGQCRFQKTECQRSRQTIYGDRGSLIFNGVLGNLHAVVAMCATAWSGLIEPACAPGKKYGQ